jgi:hypothetical protein
MSIYNKIHKTISVILHKADYINKATYYPESNLKSKSQILKDFLWYIWKYGEIDPFYFTYGFDRAKMTRERIKEEYITPYSQFQKRINQLNFQNPRYDDFHGKLTGRVITGDKFYFNIFLERFGIPTPKVYCYIKDKSPLYFNSMFSIVTTRSANEQLKAFFSNDMDAFAKPSDGQLGQGIFSLRIENRKAFADGKEISMDDLIQRVVSADYLIQERIYQHPKMATFCPSCINSIRLQTVMDLDGNVHPFGAGVRMGRMGSSVDNWAKGGVFVGINMEKGCLMDRGFLKPQYGTSTKEHPDTHIVFKDFEIPFYQEAIKAAVKLHKYLYRCHSVGWDIAITENGPVFIEGNGWWEISLIQAVHGGLKKEIEKYF